jgi:hypothetical protein
VQAHDLVAISLLASLCAEVVSDLAPVASKVSPRDGAPPRLTCMPSKQSNAVTGLLAPSLEFFVETVRKWVLSAVFHFVGHIICTAPAEINSFLSSRPKYIQGHLSLKASGTKILFYNLEFFVHTDWNG